MIIFLFLRHPELFFSSTECSLNAPSFRGFHMGAPCFNDRVPSFTEFERAYLVCYLIPFIDFY